MKRIVITVFGIIFTSAVCNAQTDDIMKMIHNKNFDKVLPLIEKAYINDTNDVNRYSLLYNYYIDNTNDDRDSLKAYFYLTKYNSLSKKKADTKALASALLPQIYKSKDIDRFNMYIELSKEHNELNKEAKRIRNQLAYEKITESQKIEDYRNFVNSYPDALQTEEALQWLNEHTLQYYIQSGNIDSLKHFAATTSSDTYKSKALSEIDKLSFSKALKENTVDSYIAYIKDFPEGNYIKMAKNNLEKVKYEQYMVQGNITDMLYYLNTHANTDKHYTEVFDKLSLKAIEHCSLDAMKTVYGISSDDKLLERFAKRYVSDFNLHTINILLDEFPSLKDNTDITNALNTAKEIENLKNKQKLTLADYTKNKHLFKNLNSQPAAKIFEEFEELNASQPKNKAVNFNLNNDIQYIQFKNAQNTELKFVLTEGGQGTVFQHNDVKIYAKADTNGYGWYPACTNRDIYVSLYENGKWQEEFVLPSVINSRYDECSPVLSKDKKTLWFSSDRGFNFGGKDIYVSFREDVNDWMSWSEPILLSEDFNTKEDDYTVGLSDNMVILSQDGNFAAENNIYLEGNTNLDIVSGKMKSASSVPLSNIKINILDKETMKTINIIRPNEKGFFAFIKPEKDVVFHASARNCFSPLTDSVLYIYNLKDILSKQELITIESPFDNNGNITSTGKKNLELLANSFGDSQDILTIGVHAVTATGKMSDKELSDKQASQITDILIKNGIAKDNLVIRGYGKDNTMQGWENINSIDIGILQK